MKGDEYTQDVLFRYYGTRISEHLSNCDKISAQCEAYTWLQEFVRPMSITTPWNWKLAKKQIAASYFGKPPSIKIDSRTQIEKGMEFIEANCNKTIRCSYHKCDRACHSESRRIDSNSLDWFLKTKEAMGENDIIEIFIESSSSSTTCFRRLASLFNEEISYEMGYGQAMYVFETERGKHDVVSADSTNGIWKISNTTNADLTEYLERLISVHEKALAMKSHCLCYFLGIPQISIEGYFDTIAPTTEPIIVDIDLPFDRAFF